MTPSQAEEEIDTASYAAETDAMFVTLVDGFARRGAADASVEDTLASIANVVGGHGGDQITGSTGANTIDGGEGNDIITPRGGFLNAMGGLITTMRAVYPECWANPKVRLAIVLAAQRYRQAGHAFPPDDTDLDARLVRAVGDYRSKGAPPQSFFAWCSEQSGAA